MMSPPLVRVRYCDAIDCGPQFQLITPTAPVAIKRVHAVGHIDARTNKCGSGQPVFLIKLEDRAHNNSRTALCFGKAQFDGYIVSFYALRADNDTH